MSVTTSNVLMAIPDTTLIQGPIPVMAIADKVCNRNLATSITNDLTEKCAMTGVCLPYTPIFLCLQRCQKFDVD